jgi:F420-0:gamma-glutamyl ligase
MIVNAIKTDRVRPGAEPLLAFLDRSLPSFEERSILAITSKIVALCEGRFISKGAGLPEGIMAAEADYYLPRTESRYGVPLTIVDNAFIARAGLDTSNTSGYYSLLPKDSYATAKEVRAYLAQRFGVNDVGVIIVDSHSSPLRRGVTGVAIGWSGFEALKNYEHVPDIFGHLFTTHANHVDALATTASLVMGDGDEQTPLALITHIGNVNFKAGSPTAAALKFFKPKLEDDLFAPLMAYSRLRKGRRI